MNEVHGPAQANALTAANALGITYYYIGGPVILIGALGGMVSAGIVGLFVGAVLLAVGYQVFMDWVDSSKVESDQSGDDPSQTGVHPS